MPPRVGKRLFQLDLHKLDTRRARVADAAWCAGLLPIKVAKAQPLVAIGFAGDNLGDLAAVDDDPDSGRFLGDGGDRLARLQHEPPSARPLVVEDLRIAGNLARSRRKTARLRPQQ